MDEKLKTCPFCGGKGVQHSLAEDGSTVWATGCEMVDCLMYWYESPIQADNAEIGIKAWNTRAHDDGAVAYCEPDNPFNETAFAWLGSERDELRHTMPLYTHPPRTTEDARDAARYRWLRDLPRNYDGRKNGFHVTLAMAKDKPREWVIESIRGLDLDAAIDAALSACGEAES